MLIEELKSGKLYRFHRYENNYESGHLICLYECKNYTSVTKYLRGNDIFIFLKFYKEDSIMYTDSGTFFKIIFNDKIFFCYLKLNTKLRENFEELSSLC